MIGKYLWVFLISMVPIIELRGAIPVAVKYASGALHLFLRTESADMGLR